MFDALPAPAVVVDRDGCIIDFNVQAARLIDRVPFAVFRPRAGQALACIHSGESPDGCAHVESCHDCPIRNAVQQVFQTGQACRRPAHLELARDGATIVLDLLVSVTPIPNEAEPLALLMLEDAAELSALLRKFTSSSLSSKARAKVLVRKMGSN